MKSGEEALKDYSFGKKRVLHKFCGQCGSSVYLDPRMKEFGQAPPDLLGVNVSFAWEKLSLVASRLTLDRCKVRMFAGVKVEDLDITHVNNLDS